MTVDFTDRIAVLTGGASGIGAAVAARLEAEHATAVRWDVSDGADVPCDVGSPESIAAALATTISRYGTPTVLVAAAGVATSAAVLDIEPDDWDRVLRINARGVLLSYQAVARAVIAAGEPVASFVGIASINGVLTDPNLVAYSASKAAVFHLSKIAANELGRYGIRINAVGPGPTATPMFLPTASAEYLADRADQTPLGIIGTPELVADTVVNVLRSDWLTGQTIMADGGASLVSASAAARRRWGGLERAGTGT